MFDPSSPSAELIANLSVLQAKSPALFERLSWGFRQDHLVETPAGDVLYDIGGSPRVFVLTAHEMEALLPKLDGEREVFLFGVGYGELVQELLRRYPDITVTAWDRDPAMLMLALSTHDFGPELSSRRLRFLLGVDLLLENPHQKSVALVAHPFFAQVYPCEFHIAVRGVNERRALVCSGALFVDDLSRALERLSYSVYTVDSQRLSPEELTLIAQVAKPEFVATINYPTGLVEFCEELGLKLICWEVDPSTSALEPCRSKTDRAFIFTYRKAHVPLFRNAGFANVEHVVFAADIEKRRPVALSESERQRYGAVVSFVGSSMVTQVQRFLATFAEMFRRVYGDAAGSASRAERIVSEVLAEQRRSYPAYLIPGALEQRCPELLAAYRLNPKWDDPVLLIAEVAAAERRLAYVAELGEFGIAVWGDSGWKQVEKYGAKHMGSAGHFAELTKIYSGTLINVDIGRLYQLDMITMRVFDILSSGGFVLAEYSDDLAETFEVGHELVAYRTLPELKQAVRHYAEHPEEAREIALRGMEKVRRLHSMDVRVEHMLAVAKCRVQSKSQ